MEHFFKETRNDKKNLQSIWFLSSYGCSLIRGFDSLARLDIGKDWSIKVSFISSIAFHLPVDLFKCILRHPVDEFYNNDTSHAQLVALHKSE